MPSNRIDAVRPGHPGLGNKPSMAATFRFLAPCLLLAGCISDSELLAENSAIALQSVHQRALDDLGCAAVRETLLAEQEDAGQPLGELYSEYHIQAQGCGREMVYVLLCRDRKLCSFKEP
ncbi:MAG: hypothetical protein LUO80_07870 [Methylococcaceae bacterium]|jgi:hypothetical protein|nr:hypothetical protein [Methylococcaceae bacterium]